LHLGHNQALFAARNPVAYLNPNRSLNSVIELAVSAWRSHIAFLRNGGSCGGKSPAIYQKQQNSLITGVPI